MLDVSQDYTSAARQNGPHRSLYLSARRPVRATVSLKDFTGLDSFGQDSGIKVFCAFGYDAERDPAVFGERSFYGNLASTFRRFGFDVFLPQEDFNYNTTLGESTNLIQKKLNPAHVVLVDAGVDSKDARYMLKAARYRVKPVLSFIRRGHSVDPEMRALLRAHGAMYVSSEGGYQALAQEVVRSLKR